VTVRGAATAAAIWATAALGVAVAEGELGIALALGFIGFVTLRWLRPLKRAAKSARPPSEIEASLEDADELDADVDSDEDEDEDEAEAPRQRRRRAPGSRRTSEADSETTSPELPRSGPTVKKDGR